MSSISDYIERLKEKPLATSLIALSQSRDALSKLSDPNGVSAEVIERDISKISPELYAFIFRQAGLKSTYSVDEGLTSAITKLGFERVKRLIFFYIAYSNEVGANSSSFDREFVAQLWLLNFSLGSTAEHWANFRSQELGNEAFYLGMFQNIGISAFAQLEPSKHRALRDGKRKVPLAEKEKDVFGFNHYELGWEESHKLLK